jgi:RNA 3'-terminal phosphate cyclase (ATP)
VGRSRELLAIDGSIGEGGGQVLRTALALSLSTGRPFRIDNIRANRPKPGLLRQHLTAVQAATAVGRARVSGDTIGSTSVTFEPGPVEHGAYTFAIGSAGSTTLVFQTVLLPLLLAPGSSTLALEGGTHNPAAPPFDFLQRVFLPIVARLGGRVELSLERAGFYPAGGGRFIAHIEGGASLGRLDLRARGAVVRRRVRAQIANLPRHIAEREVKATIHRLNWDAEAAEVEVVSSIGPGNVLFVEIECEHAAEILAGFGEAGVPAEAIANRTAGLARRYLVADAPVGVCLADQLLPLLAMGQGGTFRTMSLSRHTRTNADIVRMFRNVTIDVVEHERDAVDVTVTTEPRASGAGQEETTAANGAAITTDR